MKKSEKNISSVKKNKVRNDVILVTVIVIIAVAVLLFINATKVQGDKVVVKINGVETEAYSLSEDTKFEIITGKDNENINVVVIENGKCVEMGTYDELMSKKGKFYELKSLTERTTNME